MSTQESLISEARRDLDEASASKELAEEECKRVTSRMASIFPDGDVINRDALAAFASEQDEFVADQASELGELKYIESTLTSMIGAYKAAFSSAGVRLAIAQSRLVNKPPHPCGDIMLPFKHRLSIDYPGKPMLAPQTAPAAPPQSNRIRPKVKSRPRTTSLPPPRVVPDNTRSFFKAYSNLP